MSRLHLASLCVALHVLFFAAWAGIEQSRLAAGSGQSVLVRTVPVDPRDLLRGQYLNLAYEFSRASNGQLSVPGAKPGATVWVVLAPDGRFHKPQGVFLDRPETLEPARVVIRGRVDGGRYRFGIEKYFVPEGSDTPLAQDTTVRLRIGNDGRPRIEQVFVSGVPWP